MTGSTAAVMLVRDEADIIETTVRHLLANVSAVFVNDNRSTDGTRVILDRLADEFDGRVSVADDPEVGYFQSAKTTRTANAAAAYGYDWIVPCDADEIWYTPDGTRIEDWLDALPDGVGCVNARLLNHIATALDDPDDPDPTRRIRWRFAWQGTRPKVAVRWSPEATIHMGNHSADGWMGRAVAAGPDSLQIRHFPWRGVERYVRKIRNGEEAYAATDMPEAIGAHWRMFAGQPDDAIRQHYRTWFEKGDPHADDNLVFDPAPVTR